MGVFEAGTLAFFTPYLTPNLVGREAGPATSTRARPCFGWGEHCVI